MSLQPEDQRWHWRCRGCGGETHLDGRGGQLNCTCEDLGDPEFQVDVGKWADGEWHSMNEITQAISS